MGKISSIVEWIREGIRHHITWRHLWRNWYLGRHACLGYDVLKYYKHLPRGINFQKGRADLFSQCFLNQNLLPKSAYLKRFMARLDVLELIDQLKNLPFVPKRAPQFIFMDSFAELTDQLFVNRTERWQFCCAFSDVNHSEHFSGEYVSNGLLPIKEIKRAYLDLFAIFEKRWGDVPIYFLHFPIALETREIFKERYQKIIEIIDEIAMDLPNLYSIRIDESRVVWPQDLPVALRDFPYHYDEATYKAFREQIEAVAPLMQK